MKVRSGISFKINLSQQNNENKELYHFKSAKCTENKIFSRPYVANQNLKHLSGQKMIYLKWQTQIRVLNNMG